MQVKVDTVDDPIATIGQRIDVTISQVQEILQSVSSSVEKFIPDVATITKKTTYSASYYLAYGTVYAAMSTIKFFSGDNPVSQGFREGASAARSTKSRVPVKKAPQKQLVSKPRVKTVSSAKQKAVKNVPQVKKETP